MKNLIRIVAISLPILYSFTLSASAQQHKLEKQWETDSTLKVPESVLFDAANNVLYVANIDGEPAGKDGKGSIGKVGTDGKIIATDWVGGLNAPKGMALVKNTLWVADVDEVVAIDIKTGQVSSRVKIDGAKFLNDVTADASGAVYVSDSETKMVHKVENGKATVYLQGLQGPNGLLMHNKELYVLDNGTMNKVGKDKQLQQLAQGLEGHTDGIEHVQGNEFIVSCWSGVIYYVKADGTSEKLLDTREQKINSADIGYDSKNRIVYVPTFFKNSVVAYRLQ
jgi:glucose/arabinose dehydrogenase